MFGTKKWAGGSVLQELCLFVVLNVHVWLIVHTFSTPRAFFLIHVLYICVTDILKMCMWKLNDEKIFFDKFAAYFSIIVMHTLLYPLFSIVKRVY